MIFVCKKVKSEVLFLKCVILKWLVFLVKYIEKMSKLWYNLNIL